MEEEHDGAGPWRAGGVPARERHRLPLAISPRTSAEGSGNQWDLAFAGSTYVDPKVSLGVRKLPVRVLRLLFLESRGGPCDQPLALDVEWAPW